MTDDEQHDYMLNPAEKCPDRASNSNSETEENLPIYGDDALVNQDETLISSYLLIVTFPNTQRYIYSSAYSSLSSIANVSIHHLILHYHICWAIAGIIILHPYHLHTTLSCHLIPISNSNQHTLLEILHIMNHPKVIKVIHKFLILEILRIMNHSKRQSRLIHKFLMFDLGWSSFLLYFLFHPGGVYDTPCLL